MVTVDIDNYLYTTSIFPEGGERMEGGREDGERCRDRGTEREEGGMEGVSRLKNNIHCKIKNGSGPDLNTDYNCYTSTTSLKMITRATLIPLGAARQPSPPTTHPPPLITTHIQRCNGGDHGHVLSFQV